ncbi:hypothetical protein [Desulfitobacterium sp. AusDCA]|uniref:hypothetical protein n=1 Tax=Desulfitobacterium sp. AusDCA TaxID=3240383 RepID=UPI003DA714EF
MFFPENTQQDIKTFWGIPIDQLLKILIPLGLGLMFFLLWVPFPWGILGKTIFALALFFGVALALALKLPRYYRIIKDYLKRPKILADRLTIPEPTTHKQKKKALVGPIQDSIDIEKIYILHDKVLLERKDGIVSLICHVQAQPIDFLSSSQLKNIQEGIKSALAVAASNHMILAWIEDSDFAYNESFWEEQKNSALEHIVDLPQAVPVTMARMDCYEGLIHGEYAKDLGVCIQSSAHCRIDADLAEMMREEIGSSDQEKKERALRQFAYTTDNIISAMAGADLHLFPMDLWEVGHLIFNESVPWLRGCRDESKVLMQWMEPIISPIEEDRDDLFQENVPFYGEDNDVPTTEVYDPGEKESLFQRENNHETLLQQEEAPVDVDNPKDSFLGKTEIHHTAQSLTTPPLIQSRFIASLVTPIQSPKKVNNPFAKKVDKTSSLWARPQQSVSENVISLQRLFPSNVVVLVGSKRYVGTTTVAVHLADQQSVLVNLGRGSQPTSWPADIQVIHIQGDNRVADIHRLASTYPFVVVDLGLLTEDCEDILRVSSKVLYVMDNEPMSLDLAKQHFSLLPKEGVLLAIMKANPNGFSPGLLSSQLGASVGLVIPNDQNYKDEFGLKGPSAPWEILHRMLKERKVSVL